MTKGKNAVSAERLGQDDTGAHEERMGQDDTGAQAERMGKDAGVHYQYLFIQTCLRHLLVGSGASVGLGNTFCKTKVRIHKITFMICYT